MTCLQFQKTRDNGRYFSEELISQITAKLKDMRILLQKLENIN